jgi:hypothetical protein
MQDASPTLQSYTPLLLRSAWSWLSSSRRRPWNKRGSVHSLAQFHLNFINPGDIPASAEKELGKANEKQAPDRCAHFSEGKG